MFITSSSQVATTRPRRMRRSLGKWRRVLFGTSAMHRRGVGARVINPRSAVHFAGRAAEGGSEHVGDTFRAYGRGRGRSSLCTRRVLENTTRRRVRSRRVPGQRRGCAHRGRGEGRSERYRLRNRRRRRSAFRVGTRRTATGRARVPGVCLSPRYVATLAPLAPHALHAPHDPLPAKCVRGRKVHFGVRSPAENALNFAAASTVYRPSVVRRRGFVLGIFFFF